MITNKTQLKIFFITVLIVLIAICGGLYLGSHDNKSSRAQKPKADITHVLARDGSKQEKAIASAQNYLIDTLQEVDPYQRLILDYLQRKFDLSSQFDLDKVALHGAPFNPNEPKELDALRRIALPNDIVAKLPTNKELEATSIALIHAANCDHTPLPGDFVGLLQANAGRGGYEMTHVILALSFIADNRCAVVLDSITLLNQLASSMVLLVNDPNTIADLRYEAIAFLMQINRHDLIQQAWIDKIISEQRPDGSWSLEVGANKGSDHATTLALWALLEYARPNTPNEPFIHHP